MKNLPTEGLSFNNFIFTAVSKVTNYYIFSAFSFFILKKAIYCRKLVCQRKCEICLEDEIAVWKASNFIRPQYVAQCRFDE
jgi:hypothetical protein